MEFLDIQPVSTGELYHIDQPEDLILSFESRNNAGDQIEMFLTVAETKPAEAIEIFGTIATNQLGAIQALSYQGFSKLEPKIKKAIANFQLEQSQELFQILCQEVRKNQNNESKHLACWSAAQALQEIGFSQANLQHPEGGNLAEPLTRIQKRIISQKIKEISIIRRLDIVGEFEANYETYLEFWIYGPTQKLFDAPLEDSQYISIVKDVMNCLQVRGIQLGFEATNKKVKNIAIEQLKKIFEKYKYNKNSKLKLALGDSLQRFLKSNHTNNTDLDKIAEALLFQHKNDNFNADQLDSFTISELNKLSRNQIQKKQEIVDLFHNAKEVCDPSILQEFFKYQKNKYVAEIEPKINQINAQIQKTSSEQARTKENVKILNKALETIKNIDHEFFVDKIQSLYDEYRKLSKEPKTYIECKSIQSELNTVKDKLIAKITTKIKDLDNEHKELNSTCNFNEACAESALLLCCGPAIMLATFAISNVISVIVPLAINFNPQPPQPYSCPSNTQVYRSGEAQRYVILICSSENSPTTPKYYVGYDKDEKTNMTLPLNFAENDVFIANNKKYIYKANFNAGEVTVTFPDSKQKNLSIRMNNQSNSQTDQNTSDISKGFYLFGGGIFIIGILRFLIAWNNKTDQSNQTNQLNEKSQQLTQLTNTISQNWK